MKALIVAGALALMASVAHAESPTTGELLDRANRSTDTMITVLTEQKNSVCPNRTGARSCQGKFDSAKAKAASIGIEMTMAITAAAVGDKEKASACLANAVALRTEFNSVVAELDKKYGE
ncbi:MAG: hypothetical protein KBD06_05400 [Candidatus Pacebacteria bacterium]|nr:hypothetical protein [Candidatus Paceibacterota bacterium]